MRGGWAARRTLVPRAGQHPRSGPIGAIPETGEPMELIQWDEEGGKAIGIYSMTGGGKTNLLDEPRERITAMDVAQAAL